MRISSRLRKLLVVPVAAVTALSITMVPASAFAAATSPALTALQHDATQSSHTIRYAALGDSVAAGLGYGVGIEPSEELACGRSAEAYGYKLADKLNAKLSQTNVKVQPQNIACQGATTRDLLEGQTLGSTTIAPQLDRAFANGAPHLLTLTAGANDVRWANFIGACFSAAACDTPQNTAAAQAYIAAMKSDMKTAIKSIKDRSHFLPPVVVVTGYYTPVSGQCVNTNFSASELAWIQKATADLNTAIRQASQDSYWFARYAPVDFSSHDICAADSWIQRPGETAPFHPTPRGQEAIADAVLAAIGVR